MAAKLFQIPKEVPLTIAGALIPGAKAYFYITDTTTLQNVYTDSALSVAHTNPVVADANGFFDPIYLDDTLNYKVNVTDASDSSLPGYPVNDLAALNVTSGAVVSLADADGFYTSTNFEDGATEIGKAVGMGVQLRSALIDDARTSVNTLFDDTVLTGISLEANTLYSYEIFIAYTQNVGDFQFDLSLTQAVQWARMNYEVVDESSTHLADTKADGTGFTDGPYSITTMTDNEEANLYIRGSFLSHASQSGTISFQWAQSGINANPTTRLGGSYFRVQKLQ